MKISKAKKDKISEQILSYLYHSFPKTPFTAEIAREIIRDEEFVKRLLLELSDKGLIIPIKKNSKGNLFLRRSKWRLSNKVYEIYKSKQ
jgi:predicted transcriptional regulator with HTH domain